MLAAGALALAGCGGGGSRTVANTAQAQFVALGNTICRELRANPRAHSRPDASVSAREQARLSRFRAAIASETQLPGISTFRSDLAARKRIQLAMLRSVSPTKSGIAANALQLFEQPYRIDVKVWGDEKALGLNACMGPHPRKPISG
jgi:hypothetical protein